MLNTIIASAVMATATHATRAKESQRPRSAVGGGEACVLNPRSCTSVPSVTTSPYNTTVSRTLRRALRAGTLGNLPGKTSGNLGSIRSRRDDTLARPVALQTTVVCTSVRLPNQRSRTPHKRRYRVPLMFTVNARQTTGVVRQVLLHHRNTFLCRSFGRRCQECRSRFAGRKRDDPRCLSEPEIEVEGCGPRSWRGRRG